MHFKRWGTDVKGMIDRVQQQESDASVIGEKATIRKPDTPFDKRNSYGKKRKQYSDVSPIRRQNTTMRKPTHTHTCAT